MEKRLIALEVDTKRLNETKDELTKQNNSLKTSIKFLQKDADFREKKMQKMHLEILEVNQAKETLEKKKDELSSDVASLKRLVADSNKLKNKNRDLLRQIHILQCTLEKATVPLSSQESNKQGRRKEAATKVKQNSARKISLRRHQAFLNQSIKVMSGVFENFSKDGWEDVSEDRYGSH